MEYTVHGLNKSLENLTEIYEGICYVEEWKDIADYEGLYQASSFGRIKSFPKNNRKTVIITGNLNAYGYIHVSLYRDDKRMTYQSHVLIARTFIPNPENKPEVNHKKGIKIDNRVHQLEWHTGKENREHAIAIGLITLKGENGTGAKLKNKDVLDISTSTLQVSELCKKYGITKSTVSAIRLGKTWSYLTGIKYSPQWNKLSDDVIGAILNSTLKDVYVSKLLNIHQASVRYYRHKFNYSYQRH